jgi:hypothetical protein
LGEQKGTNTAGFKMELKPRLGLTLSKTMMPVLISAAFPSLVLISGMASWVSTSSFPLCCVLILPVFCV